MGPFATAITRDAIVDRITDHPIDTESEPETMRAAFARLVLGNDRDPYDGSDTAAVLGSPVLASADGLTVLPRVDPSLVGGGERYTPDRLVIWFHGGGYVFGAPETHLRPAARLAARLGVPILLPRYPLAPEHEWPAQFEFALDIATRALASPSPHGANGRARIVLAGDSAGGHLALVAALELGRRDMSPAGLLLFAPNTDRTDLSDTRERMSPRDPMNADRDDRRLATMCFGDMPNDHRQISPVRDDLRLLPPAHIEVGDPEVLLGDSVVLHERARAAGADCTLHVEPNLLHMGQLWCPWWEQANASVARAADRAKGWLE